MEQQPNNLLELLQRHLELYRMMEKVLAREQAALIGVNLELLKKVTAVKATLVKNIHDHVQVLSRAIEEIAGQNGLSAEPLPTLAELAAILPHPESREIKRGALELARLKRNVGQRNDANKMFVKESLTQISGSISILTGAAAHAPKAGYHPQGQKPPRETMRPVRLSREV